MKNKALIIVPSFRVTDGISTALMNYYENLLKGDWSVDFTTLYVPEGKWLNIATAKGSNVYVLSQVNKYSGKIRKEIKQIIEQGDYSIVHANFPGIVTNVAIRCAKKKKCKIIYHCHNPKNLTNFKGRISNVLFDSFAIKRADLLLACSMHVGKSKYGNEKYTVLKNLIDVDKFIYSEELRSSLRSEYKLQDKDVIGVVGRMVPQKNPFFILDVFLEVSKININAHLVWIGTGSLENQVIEYAKKLGIYNRCSFVGKQSNVNEWYSALDLFFLPSQFEGFGIVFIEAQCSGLYCLTSDKVPDDVFVTELMYKKSLVDSRVEWAKQICELLQKKHSSVRKSRVIDIKKAGFSIQAGNDALLNIYNKMVKCDNNNSNSIY